MCLTLRIHVSSCCSEIFFDNATRAFGNDSSIDWMAAGYQTSEHVIAVLGSEDWYDRLSQQLFLDSSSAHFRSDHSIREMMMALLQVWIFLWVEWR
jgi:hypothetical protein